MSRLAGLGAVTPRLLDDLRLATGPERVLGPGQDLSRWGHDVSLLTQMRPAPPGAVVLPETTAEVVGIVRAAGAARVPVVARGAGTSQTGAPVAACGGIVVDFTRMNRILEVDPANRQVLVEPGVVHGDLNAALAGQGMWFAPDPASTAVCTLGGVLANNASGMGAVKHGTPAGHTLGLEVVLADGTVIETGVAGGRSLKTASGYDLTRLLVGSEGTLGLITRARLLLTPLPSTRGLVVAAFPSVKCAVEAGLAVFAAGLGPAACELLDSAASRAARLRSAELNLPDGVAMLFVLFDGTEAEVAGKVAEAGGLCGASGAAVEATTSMQRFRDLWRVRTTVGAALAGLRAGRARAVYAGEDIAVPPAAVAEALDAIDGIAALNRLTVGVYCHLGDGIIHAVPVVDPQDRDEQARALAAGDEVHQLALRLRGTTTGEHGVGLVRGAFMRDEHGPALDAMRRIKQALDPAGLLNPGKLGL